MPLVALLNWRSSPFSTYLDQKIWSHLVLLSLSQPLHCLPTNGSVVLNLALFSVSASPVSFFYFLLPLSWFTFTSSHLQSSTLSSRMLLVSYPRPAHDLTPSCFSSFCIPTCILISSYWKSLEDPTSCCLFKFCPAFVCAKRGGGQIRRQGKSLEAVGSFWPKTLGGWNREKKGWVITTTLIILIPDPHIVFTMDQTLPESLHIYWLI